MQSCVTLSVTEAEMMAAVSCVQEMLFIKNVIESMEMKVKLPLKLSVDNKGAVDAINNWNVGGRTRHVAVKINFLRELKEIGIIEVEWIPSNENCADMFTKNLPSQLFEKHTQRFCGEEDPNQFQWEGVGVTDQGVGTRAAHDEVGGKFHQRESDVTKKLSDIPD